jgi:hypothetical protein
MTQLPSGIQGNDAGAQGAPHEAVTPWSFALPMAAGVFLGVLIFGLLLLAYLQGQMRAGAERPDSGATASAPSSRSAQAAASAPLAGPQEAEPARALPRLPGLIEANRRHLKTACIAGTVGHRQENGWTQAVASNAPRRCIATTQ